MPKMLQFYYEAGSDESGGTAGSEVEVLKISTWAELINTWIGGREDVGEARAQRKTDSKEVRGRSARENRMARQLHNAKHRPRGAN